jgi:CheY-like chemotaxis protein
LNGILGAVGPLGQSELDPRQKHMVGLIQSSGAALQRILNGVLDMVELGSGQLRISPEPFHLPTVLERLASGYATEARAKGLAFDVAVETPEDASLLGDHRRLEQILANLLSNAVKFTQHGSVTLSVGIAPDGAHRFAVHDTGIGFDPAEAEPLFQPFSQADGSVTRSAGGAGLGLFLAREMARAMGGEVVGEGRPGNGATFILTLPLQTLAADPAGATPVAAPAQSAAAGEAAAPVRVLVADDHPTNRAVIELILAGLDVALTGVENGAEAVDAFTEQPFDVVLMDLQMPVMDGLTAIRRIRELERRERREPTPIIVVSANVQGEHMSASAAAGADDHIAKPVSAPLLFAALDKALSRAAVAANDPDPGPRAAAAG